MQSVLDMAQGFFGSDTLGRVSAWLRESPDRTQTVVKDALPASVIGLANQASSEEGSRELLGRFQRGDYPHLEPEELGRAVSDPDVTDRLVRSNQGFVEKMFGGKLGGVVDGVAAHSGASPSAVSKVLALAGPVVLGMIGKRAVAQNLDARGLRSFLNEQARMASNLLPGPLNRLLVPAGVGAAVVDHRRVPVPIARSRPTGWLWPLIGLLAVLSIGLLVWNRVRTRHESASPSTSAGLQLESAFPLSAGSVAALNGFLEDDRAVPRRFVLDGLRFQTDSADIEEGTRQVLDDVGDVLAAHPRARIRIDGHTDGTGATDVNRQLSHARAEAAKQYLASRGVDGARIETEGYGAELPIASNATAEGRAKNRRTELTVLAK